MRRNNYAKITVDLSIDDDSLDSITISNFEKLFRNINDKLE